MSNEMSIDQLLQDILAGKPLPSEEEILAKFSKTTKQEVAKQAHAHGVQQVVQNVAVNEHGGAGNAAFALPELFADLDSLPDPRVEPELAPVVQPSCFASVAARPAWGVVPGQKASSGGNSLTRPTTPVNVLADPAFTPEAPTPEPRAAEPEDDKLFADQDVAEPTRIVIPQFGVEEIMDTLDLRNFAVLVTLNTSRWGGKVKDRQASIDVGVANDASADAFVTRKNLLAGADGELKKICKTLDDARTAHYKMTVPWSTTSMEDVGKRSGGRLLPNTLFMEYTTVMAHKLQEMKDALDVFIPMYPQLIAEAQKKLGKRFDPREYPVASSIRQHFDLSFEFMPIPKGDDFKGLADKQVEALARKLNRNLTKMTQNAMEDLWVRMHAAVQKIAERLKSPDKIFHQSSLQNLKDIARLAAHLNVTGDSKVESVRKKIEMHLCQASAEDLRKNGVLRAQVAGHAQSILEEMSS